MQAALDGLAQLRPTMPVRTRVAYAPAGAGHVRIWAVAEIDSTTSREGAWLGGGTVDAALSGADNRALASAEGAMAGNQRTVLLDLGQVDAPETGTSLARPAAAGRRGTAPEGSGGARPDWGRRRSGGAAADATRPDDGHALHAHGRSRTSGAPNDCVWSCRAQRRRAPSPRRCSIARAGRCRSRDDGYADRRPDHLGDGRGVARAARARRLRHQADSGRDRGGDGDTGCAVGGIESG